MDISSGDVDFGSTCPSSLMEQLLNREPEAVRKIKILRTSYTSYLVNWLCHAYASDLNIVKNFVEGIDALQELSILNFENDLTILWPAIFKHGGSLTKLAIHTPPMLEPDVWTVTALQQVPEKLPKLEALELDLPLAEAERILKTIDPATVSSDTQPAATQPSLSDSTASILSTIAKLPNLSSLLISITLQNSASSFANIHTYNAMGSTSFPPLKQEPCKQIAKHFFRHLTSQPGSKLQKLDVRFARRCWDDRAQFWTVGHLVHVMRKEVGRLDGAEMEKVKDETETMTEKENEVVVEMEENFKTYLPNQPSYGSGILYQLWREGYDANRKW